MATGFGLRRERLLEEFVENSTAAINSKHLVALEEAVLLGIHLLG